MTYRPTPLGCLFLLLAALCTACEVWGVAEFAIEQAVKPYVLLASACMALVAPALPEIAKWARRSRHYVAALVALGSLVFCLLVVMGAAIQRTGSATDVAEARREQAKVARAAAAKTEAETESAYKIAQEAAIKECEVRKARCMDAEAKAADLRVKLVSARTSLVTASIEQSDPFAKRLAAVTFGHVSEDQIRLLWPLLIPVGISLLAATMFSGWVRVDFAPEPKELPQGPPQTPVAAPATKPQLSLVPSPAVKFGAVAVFLVKRTEPAALHELEIAHTMYGSYCEWCKDEKAQPLDPNKFSNELWDISQTAGLKIEFRGKSAYCLGMRLAA